MKSLFQIVVSLLVLVLVAGCGTRPILNVDNAPIVTSKKNVSMEEVEKAIRSAGISLGWQMTPVQPGLIKGVLNLRTHTAIVDISYNTKSYNIIYKDSVNLDYRDGQIHKNYIGWIQNLDRGIRTKLSEL